jgi:hypothetical protein
MKSRICRKSLSIPVGCQAYSKETCQQISGLSTAHRNGGAFQDRTAEGVVSGMNNCGVPLANLEFYRPIPIQYLRGRKYRQHREDGIMPCEIVENIGCLLVAKIAGKLSKPEIDAAQKAAVDVIGREGRVRILILAENFQGWEEKGNWGDLSFMVKYDNQIERIAVVGEKKWEDLTIAFTGKGMRSAQVEYFLPAQLATARTWVTA